MDNKTKSESMVTDLTSGNVAELLVKFTMPLFVANLLQAVYNLVDMVVVGQVVGGIGMSAVSIGGDVLHILTFLAIGFSSAGQVLIAQYVGMNSKDRVKKIIGTMFTLLLASSLVISVVCFVFREGILNLLNTPGESYGQTMDYMVTCSFGLFFIYGYNIVSAILRGMGDSKRPFFFIAIAAIVNTVLDIIFVAVFDMKAYGAALATVIGQGFSFIASVIYLYRHKDSFGFDFKLQSFAISGDVLGPFVALGIPMAIQSAAVNISKLVVMAWTNMFGVTYSAIGGIYSKSAMMLNVIANSFTTAGSSMVGQNLGAKKYNRVPKILSVIFVISISIACILTILFLLFPNAVFEMFTSDITVLASVSIVMAPMIMDFYGSGTRSIAFSLINGSGNSKLNLMVALIDGMISRIGFAALLGFAFKMGPRGFWFGDAIAGFVPITISMIYFCSGKWKHDL